MRDVIDYISSYEENRVFDIGSTYDINERGLFNMYLDKLSKIPIIILILLSALLLIGCSKYDIKGIVLDVEDDTLIISEGLTTDQYDNLKGLSVKDLQNEDVLGEIESLHLIHISYKDANKFVKGDEVLVWINGGVMISYPPQANAKKVKHLKEEK